jgi:hypothetical protein
LENEQAISAKEQDIAAKGVIIAAKEQASFVIMMQIEKLSSNMQVFK